MKSVLILGGDGMLGSAIREEFCQEEWLQCVVTSRRALITDLKFDALQDPIQKLDLGKYHYIINCIGVIKQKFDISAQNYDQDIRKVNSELPRMILDRIISTPTKLIQIATDCVFSGAKGKYSEVDTPDPVDLYGISKLNGEVAGDNVLQLRSSIVGRENQGNSSLLEWFLSRPNNSKIDGYTNHIWNGVTAYHFAKIVKGIIQSDGFVSGKYHLVPADVVSKAELLEIFQEKYSRHDIKIVKKEHENRIDRSLVTQFPELIDKLWKQAGYDKPPTINQMIDELSKK